MPVTPLFLALSLLFVSCASHAPRAIIISEVSKLDVAPVTKSARDVSKAVKEVVAAHQDSKAATVRMRTTTDRMLEAIRRSETFAKADAERYAAAVSDDLSDVVAYNVILEERIVVADGASDVLIERVGKLEEDKILQDKEIDKNTKAAYEAQRALFVAESSLQAEKVKSAFRLKVILWGAAVVAVFLIIKLCGAALWVTAKAYIPWGRGGG